MHRVCVFCGSSFGSDPTFRLVARRVGAIIASRGLSLVYGGGNIGLMGEMANSALERGGHVIGVIPRALADRELAHGGLPDLRVVESMHERKAVMADLADAFIALPGGLGTLEELCEILTWAQLGFHAKPCGLLSVSGYFDGLLRFLEHAVANDFVRHEHLQMLVVDDDPQNLMDKLAQSRPPVLEKWISRDET